MTLNLGKISLEHWINSKNELNLKISKDYKIEEIIYNENEIKIKLQKGEM